MPTISFTRKIEVTKKVLKEALKTPALNFSKIEKTKEDLKLEKETIKLV